MKKIIGIVFAVFIFGDISVYSQDAFQQNVYVPEPFGTKVESADLEVASGAWKLRNAQRASQNAIDDLFGKAPDLKNRFWEKLYFVEVVENGDLILALMGWSSDEQVFQIKNVTVHSRNFNDQTILFFELYDKHFLFAKLTVKNKIAKIHFANRSLFENAISEGKISGTLKPVKQLIDGHAVDAQVVVATPNVKFSNFIERNFENCFSKQAIIVHSAKLEE